MQGVGWVLIIGGLLLVAAGIVILALGAIQLFRQMFLAPTPKAVSPAGGGAGASAVNLADLAKLIEAIIKMPQWLLALLAGDVQIWIGYWLATGTRLF